MPREAEIAVERALAGRDASALAALVDEGADLNEFMVPTDERSRTPLDYVLRLNDPAFLDAVLSLPGVSPARSLPKHGYWAWAQRAPLSVIQTFLDRTGIDPAHRDADGRNLLIEVASGDASREVIDWLLDQMAVDHVASDGTTAFFHTVVHGHLEAAAALLGAGANPNAASRYTGWTALVTSVTMGLTEEFHWLLDIDAIDVNRADNEGATALHHAARLGAIPAVESLVGHLHIDLTRHDRLGRTALMDAARHGHAAAVEILLRPQDAGVNLVDSDRRTALHFAVIASSLETVQRLLTRPDINLAITERPGGLTALQLAREVDHDSIAGLLHDAAQRLGPQPDTPANSPALRPPPVKLGDPLEFPAIGDPLPDRDGF